MREDSVSQFVASRPGGKSGSESRAGLLSESLLSMANEETVKGTRRRGGGKVGF